MNEVVITANALAVVILFPIILYIEVQIGLVIVKREERRHPPGPPIL
jgi:hypothetical protein